MTASSGHSTTSVTTRDASIATSDIGEDESYAQLPVLLERGSSFVRTRSTNANISNESENSDNEIEIETSTITIANRSPTQRIPSNSPLLSSTSHSPSIRSNNPPLLSPLATGHSRRSRASKKPNPLMGIFPSTWFRAPICSLIVVILLSIIAVTTVIINKKVLEPVNYGNASAQDDISAKADLRQLINDEIEKNLEPLQERIANKIANNLPEFDKNPNQFNVIKQKVVADEYNVAPAIKQKVPEVEFQAELSDPDAADFLLDELSPEVAEGPSLLKNREVSNKIAGKESNPAESEQIESMDVDIGIQQINTDLKETPEDPLEEKSSEENQPLDQLKENDMLPKHLPSELMFPSLAAAEPLPLTLISLLRGTTDVNDPTYHIQMNALMSWRMLVPAANILVFMDTPLECTQLQRKVIGIRCLPVQCWSNVYKRPMLDCIFQTASKYSQTSLIGYVNGDIVIHPGMRERISYLLQGFKSQFMMVCRRTDVKLSVDQLSQTADSDAMHVQNVIDIALKSGVLHSEYGIDLFVYHRDFMDRLKFPPFLAGVYRWDNWLLSQAVLRGDISVVDVTAHALLVHQELSGGHPESRHHRSRRGAQYNDRLVKMLVGGDYLVGHINNADFILQCSQRSTDNTTATTTNDFPSDHDNHKSEEFQSDVHMEEERHIQQKQGDIKLDIQGFGCDLTRNERLSLEVQFRRRRTSSGWVVLLGMRNAEDMPMLEHFLCWATRAEFHHFFILTTDEELGQLLAHMRYGGSVERPQGIALPYLTPTILEHNGFAQELVSLNTRAGFRANVVHSILRSRHHVFYVDMQYLWLDSPLTALPDDFDFMGHVLEVSDLTSNLPVPSISPFIFGTRATQWGGYLWKQIRLCETQRAQESMTNEDKNSILSVEEHQLSEGTKIGEEAADNFPGVTCISESIKKLRRKMRLRALPATIFATEEAFLQQQPQRAGYAPAIIASGITLPSAEATANTDDSKASSSNGPTTLHGFRLWTHLGFLMTDSHHSCREYNPILYPSHNHGSSVQVVPEPIVAQDDPLLNSDESAVDAEANIFPLEWATPPDNMGNIVLLLRILTSSDADTLSAMLTSLEAASVSDKINIAIYVHPPATPAKGTDPDIGYEKVLRLSRGFKWPHGTVDVIQLPATQTPKESDVEIRGASMIELATSWQPISENEFMVVLEDHFIVSPFFFEWIRKIVQNYYSKEKQYDPHMFGIALQHGTTILGEDTLHSYGQSSRNVIPEYFRSNQTFPFYRYQLPTPSATLYFPRQWRVFSTWLSEILESKTLLKSDISEGNESPLTHESSMVSQDTSEDTSTEPKPSACVPTLVSNRWLNRRPYSFESDRPSPSPFPLLHLWMNRFTYVRGLYFLYINTNYSLIIKSHVQKSTETRLLNTVDHPSNIFTFNSPPSTLGDEIWPALSTLPLFDFHFAQVSSTSALFQRPMLFQQLDQCYVVPNESVGRTKPGKRNSL